MNRFKQIAIIGQTASGKSALALELAQKHNGIILSIDSLSVYRYIDIASAKPSKEELLSVPHYGIDIVDPNEEFNVTKLFEHYKEAYSYAKSKKIPLIIVGGSSFYLKMMLEGISPLPKISKATKERLNLIMQNRSKAYEMLFDIDKEYAINISSSDSYRIEKGLSIFLECGIKATTYFQNNPPQKCIRDPLPIYAISINRDILKNRISNRTRQMLKSGLIDEVAYLEAKYGRDYPSMKAIGIVEVLDYFDGKLSYEELHPKISTNTARLAKRQNTFNKSQFNNIEYKEYKELYSAVDNYLLNDKLD